MPFDDDKKQDDSATPPPEQAVGWSPPAYTPSDASVREPIGAETAEASTTESGATTHATGATTDETGTAESAGSAEIPIPRPAPPVWQPTVPSGWNEPAGVPLTAPPAPLAGPRQWQAPPPPAPPTTPTQWQPQQPPAPPAWGPGWPPQSGWPPTQPGGQPQPGWQPTQPGWQPTQQGWQPQPGWQPNQPPRGFGYGPMPPAGDLRPRRPSRLPQILAVIAACLISFSAGMLTDHVAFPGTASSTVQPGSTPAANGTIQSSSLYNEALQIVKQNFVGRASVTDQQLLYGSIKGMVDSLGDTGHSTFLTPTEYAAFQASLKASVAGIGVELGSDSGVFKVDKVIAGTPAAAAGVKAGDQITAVDGVSTSGMTFDQVGANIRGAAGTKVTITVIHLGSTTPVDIAITRANIDVPLVDWGIVPGTRVADIALAEFSTGAADQVQSAMTAAQKAGATSIVLDLRGNPGGYASEAQEVASEFLSSGVVYIQQDANGNDVNENVDTGRTHTSLPLVVLVDHDSASSSEIVAGALQDSGRARVVGEPTYGTGTVLQQFTLSDGSVLILGTAWWLTPDGHRIFGVGIKPDQTVAMSSGAVPIDPTDLGTMTTSQLASSGDAELLAAVGDLNK
jgi:carboxyl-terminal processing protease